MGYPPEFDLIWGSFFKQHGRMDYDSDFTASEVYDIFMDFAKKIDPDIGKIVSGNKKFNEYCREWFKQNNISIYIESYKDKKRHYGIRFLRLALPGFKDKKKEEAQKTQRNKATSRRREDGIEPRKAKSVSIKLHPMEKESYLKTVINCLNQGGVADEKFIEGLISGKIRCGDDDLKDSIIEFHNRNKLALEKRLKEQEEREQEEEARKLLESEKEEEQDDQGDFGENLKEPELPLLVSEWESWGKENEINDENVLEWIRYYDKKLEIGDMPILTYTTQSKEAYEAMQAYFKHNLELNTILIKLKKMAYGTGVQIGIADKNILIGPRGTIEEIKTGRKKDLLIKQFKDDHKTAVAKLKLAAWTEDDFKDYIDNLLSNDFDESETCEIKEEMRSFIELKCHNLSAKQWKIE